MTELEHIKGQIQQLHKRVTNLEEWQQERNDIDLTEIHKQIQEFKEQLKEVYGK
jgi:hypothetical protein